MKIKFEVSCTYDMEKQERRSFITVRDNVRNELSHVEVIMEMSEGVISFTLVQEKGSTLLVRGHSEFLFLLPTLLAETNYRPGMNETKAIVDVRDESYAIDRDRVMHVKSFILHDFSGNTAYYSRYRDQQQDAEQIIII